MDKEKKSPKELKLVPWTKRSKKGSERAIKWTKSAENIVYVPKTPHRLSKKIRLGGSTQENVYFAVILLGTLLYKTYAPKLNANSYSNFSIPPTPHLQKKLLAKWEL